MTMTTTTVVPPPPPRAVRKITFGRTLDPDYARTVLENLVQQKWNGFCEKWNIDPETGTPGQTTSSAASTEVKPMYNWSLVSTNDPDIQYSPSIKQELPITSEVPMEVTTIATAAVAVIVSSSTSTPKSAEANQVKSSTSTGSNSSPTVRIKSPGPAGKRFCSAATTSGVRQRPITDYMKEKKKALPILVQNSEEKMPHPAAAMISSASTSTAVAVGGVKVVEDEEKVGQMQ